MRRTSNQRLAQFRRWGAVHYQAGISRLAYALKWAYLTLVKVWRSDSVIAIAIVATAIIATGLIFVAITTNQTP